jgi:HEAT repeat protein
VALVTAVGRLVREPRFWPVAITHLLGPLAKGRAAIRRAAVRALGAIAHHRPKAALAALQARVKDKDVNVRLALVEALGRVSPKLSQQAGALLVQLTGDPDARVARQAVRALLPRLGQKPIQATVAGALPGLLRRSAMRSHGLELALTLPAASVPREVEKALVRSLAATTSEADQRAVLEVARRLRYAAVARAATRSPWVRIRVAALEILASQGGKSVAHSVRQGLRDSSRPVREAALRAAATLVRRLPEELVPRLMAMATDPADPLRLAALTTLGHAAGRADARRLIRRAVENPAVSVRVAAARALGHLSKGLHRELNRLAGDIALEVRRAAVRSLAERWARRLSPGQLRRRLENQGADRQHRLAAALALHRLRAAASRHKAAADSALAAVRKSGEPVAQLLSGAALLVDASPEGEQTLVDLLDSILLF